jgi:hypothetical protein
MYAERPTDPDTLLATVRLSEGWISLTGAANPSGLATALLVLRGKKDQRRRWLPRLAGAFSITGPRAAESAGRVPGRLIGVDR